MCNELHTLAQLNIPPLFIQLLKLFLGNYRIAIKNTKLFIKININ